MRQGEESVALARDTARPPAREEPYVHGRDGVTLESRDLDRIVEAVRAAVAAVEGHPGIPIDIRIQIAGDAVRVQSLQIVPRPHDRDAARLSFADWFRAHLQARELSHEAVARRIGVSTKTITRWVTGRTEPRFRELIEICSVLGDSPL